jgi:glycine/D-amino acid oxidase-like deaminating enzyme
MEEAHTILNPPALIATEHSRWANWPKGKPVSPPADNPTKSFWIEEFRHRLDNLRSTPELPATADVVVIGTGMTGCSSVYHLTKSNPNLSIVALDARAFCSGATGRNGGHCFRPEGWGFRALVQELGPEAAVSVRRLYLKNRDMMQEFLDEHSLREKVDCNFNGGVHIFGSAKEREDQIEDLKLADELGLDHGSKVVDAQEMSKVPGSPSFERLS